MLRSEEEALEAFFKFCGENAVLDRPQRRFRYLVCPGCGPGRHGMKFENTYIDYNSDVPFPD